MRRLARIPKSVRTSRQRRRLAQLAAQHHEGWRAANPEICAKITADIASELQGVK